MNFVDSHAHWSDLRITPDLFSQMMSHCEFNRINFIMQGGVDPDDWDRQLELNNQFPGRIGLCFGLHPYFIARSTQEECEQAMDLLAKKISQSMALGETGLDLRSQFVANEFDRVRQINFFEQQIELAKAVSKPLVLHIVRAHDEAQKILTLWDLPSKPGYIHAFNSNIQNAKRYTELGFMLSVGGAITHPKNHDLRSAILQIPLESLLIESDSPDQAPLDWKGLNQSWSILRVAEEISILRKDVSAEEILKISTDNFNRLFSVPI